MDEDYGIKVGLAFQAVARLHKDIGTLFRELDGQEFSGWVSVFGSFVTRNVPKDVKKSWWMPYVVYRYYRKPENPALVEGVTCCLFSGDKSLEQPMFVVSQVEYRPQARGPQGGDVWELYFKTKERAQAGQLVVEPGSEDGRIAAARLLAVPLYSITERKAVTELIERVRNYRPAVKTDSAPQAIPAGSDP